MSALIIREARAEDLPQIAKLAAALVRLHHRWDPPRFMLFEPLEEGYRRFLQTQLGDDEVLLRVALRDEVIVGYLYGGLEERNWNLLLDRCGAIHDVYVADSERQKGVATALIEDAAAKLKAMGAPRVVLMSAQENADGQRLFEKLGFRRTMVEMTREL
jgi:ribosomal protein S18 acetylase RimI-like enzyme